LIADRTATGRDTAVDPLAPPPDPPPIRGLGIPPLDVTRVGDFDEPQAPDAPPAKEGQFSTRLADLDDPPEPRLDLRR
jgi:hypothetical protein